MQYMFLLYDNEAAAEQPTDEAGFEAMMAPWVAYTNALVEAGVMRGGEALMPTATATTLSTAGGALVTTDGPFAETTEQLGGFYLVECASLDEALKWASLCPAVETGRVEVRPIMNTDGPA